MCSTTPAPELPHELLRLAQTGTSAALTDPQVVAAAIEHRVGGLLLSAAPPVRAGSNSDLLRRLAANQMQADRHNSALWDAASSLDEVLSSIEVDWLIFKGIAAEALWYEELGDRPCGDLDVLVAPKDLRRTAEIVRAVDPSFSEPDLAQALVTAGTLQHLDLQHNGAAVDLHFDYLKVGLPTRQADLVWKTRRTVSGPRGIVLRSVSPELALVGLVLHQNKDAFSYLGPMVDVRRVVESGLDWDVVAAFVGREGLAVPFWCSLERVASILRFSVPAAPPLSRSKVAAWNRLWPSRAVLRGHRGRALAPNRQVWLPLTAQGRPKAVMSEFRRQLLPPSDLFAIAGERRPSKAGYAKRVTIDRMPTRRRSAPSARFRHHQS